jgi:hypothetical protein
MAAGIRNKDSFPATIKRRKNIALDRAPRKEILSEPNLATRRAAGRVERIIVRSKSR